MRSEFIRRFLLHVLPAGFVKIRHFGLLANRNRRQALTLCQAPSLRARDGSKLVADRTTEVCAQPVLPAVQMRHPARRRTLFRCRTAQPQRSDSLRNLRLFLRRPCGLVSQPDSSLRRLLTPPSLPYASNRLRTVHDQPSNRPVRSAAAARTRSARAHCASPRARLAVSAPRKRHPIPIHPPP